VFFYLYNNAHLNTAHRLEWEMSVNDAEKNFMTLEEERLLRLKEYAHHVSQTYLQFVPKISQVTSSLYILIYSHPDSCLLKTAVFCFLAVVATQRTDLRVRRVTRFYNNHRHGEPIWRRSERTSSARLLSGTHESGNEQKEKNIGERFFYDRFSKNNNNSNQ